MSRWKRVLISFGIVVVACVTYLWLFGTQTFFVLEAHSAARKLPFVKLTPIELTDLSVSQAPGMKLSYFGLGTVLVGKSRASPSGWRCNGDRPCAWA